MTPVSMMKPPSLPIVSMIFLPVSAHVIRCAAQQHEVGKTLPMSAVVPCSTS